MSDLQEQERVDEVVATLKAIDNEEYYNVDDVMVHVSQMEDHIDMSDFDEEVEDKEDYIESKAEEDFIEKYTIGHYIDECLDVEYIVTSDGSVKSARVYIALGGPSMWIDTEVEEVKLAWGSTKASAALPQNICHDIEDYLEEIKGF